MKQKTGPGIKLGLQHKAQSCSREEEAGINKVMWLQGKGGLILPVRSLLIPVILSNYYN